MDQFLLAPGPEQPSFQVQPPTPITATMPTSACFLPHVPTASSPVAIPPSSRPASRNGTSTSLSRSSSRHHPYGMSPASLASSISGHSFRSRSATSASERSDWESEASAYDTDLDPKLAYSPEPFGLPPFDLIVPLDAELPQPPTPAQLSSPLPSTDKPVRIGKNGKPLKSHARKTAPGHIKRPPNAFILFRSHCCAPRGEASEPDPPGTAHARHLASLDINNSQHVSLIVSQLWKGLKPDEKAYWENKARVAKEEHQRLYPGYRYKPQQRSKDSIRKRKKPDPKESREHRDACHEVARIVMNQEADPNDVDRLPVPPPTARARPRTNLMEQVLDGPSSRRSRAKARTTRTAQRKGKQSSGSEDSSPPPYELPNPPTRCDPLFRPVTSPYPSVLQASAPAQGFEPRSTSEHDKSPFAYMAQLDREIAQSSIHPNSLFAVDPRYGLLTSTVDGQALHPLSRASPPCPQTPVQQGPPALDSVAASPVAFTRPPSPTADAIRQMQSYSLGGPSPPVLAQLPSPPVTTESSTSTFTFGTSSSPFNPDAAPSLAQRRDIRFPPNLPLSALKHRRSTLRAGQRIDLEGRGDLMLISPLTTTFNGRRQSLGWSSGLRRVSIGLASGTDGTAHEAATTPVPYRKGSLSAGVLANDASFETFTFSNDVIDSFPVENPFLDADLLAQYQASNLSFPEDEFDNESERPNTASSAWSTDDAIVERLEGGFPEGFFDRRRSTLVASKFSSPQDTGSPEYHVGSTHFFGQPASPFQSQESHEPVQREAVPAFGSPEFGGSFQPFEHRPSIGTLLSSSLVNFNDTTRNDLPTESHEQEEWTMASMKDTALSILREQRNLVSPERSEPAAAECEYVLLPVEQLGDTDLLAKLHEQGYGIAFETARLDTQPLHNPLTAHSPLPSGSTMPLEDSPLLYQSSF
ncbi:uncharacterized protein JCM15063_002605 [Sporobolomyces koalae]|uniref:uncharacterized protein n=1 Tax=Sporobolomyces koalae TaxID=500713 RepID=UPI00316B6E78